ncbi:hypothetical protein H920_11748 [Fukomys damarensis]|uniref:Uncharacterized protein n=1 Tax=Fukomys damarensis TaxID=885580 RepID=A0A091D8P5_FUKDA|nr:hypothetical protein H920_11748 [Fukomys damarensis]
MPRAAAATNSTFFSGNSHVLHAALSGERMLLDVTAKPSVWLTQQDSGIRPLPTLVLFSQSVESAAPQHSTCVCKWFRNADVSLFGCNSASAARTLSLKTQPATAKATSTSMIRDGKITKAITRQQFSFQAPQQPTKATRKRKAPQQR